MAINNNTISKTKIRIGKNPAAVTKEFSNVSVDNWIISGVL